MLNQEKYLATPNLGQNDANKLGWNVGDILHTSSSVRANGYGYCGYEEMDIPRGTRVAIIGIKQTDLNACYDKNDVGDVYVDFQCIDLKNPDGTHVTCGHRHAWSLLEANPDFMLAPDGSGEIGMVRDGVWYSYAQKPGVPEDFTKPWAEQRARSIELAEVA